MDQEAKRAYWRAYYQKNKDKCKAKSVKWQKANPEKVKAGQLKYRQENREKLRARGLYYAAKKREKNKGEGAAGSSCESATEPVPSTESR